jgi:hypothetical protein
MAKRVLKVIGILALIGIAGFLLIQLVPYGRVHTNPPVLQEPQWDSPATRALAARACFDCHSNETKWPWYSYVAPASWLVTHDVDEGRSRLNLSEWGMPSRGGEGGEEGEGGRGGEGVDEVAEVIAGGYMPPAQYLLMHPDARLSDAEKQQLMQGMQASLR